ncbi:AAA family ATPase [Roseovarius sp.]|uniref:AAA family ATPase n=1 Tax=Roseovarius sp. TaxID=1486281 RepID=UPI0035623306
MTDPMDNVSPMKPKRLSAVAEKFLSRVEFAHEVKPVIERDYCIKGWIDRGAMSVVYGEANVGKSFWAIDVAKHIHQGLPWNGARVRAGNVLYLAAEGGAMFDNRLSAAKARFMVTKGAVTLAGRNSEAKPIGEVLDHLARVQDAPFALVVIDTLARVMGGADENAAPDVSSLIRSAEMIRDETGAHVMFVHHCGKDVARGARGHSSLRAAVDTEIELTQCDDGTRLARTTKQRDMPGGLEQSFTLEQVDLGRDSDGDAVTSCIVKTRGAKDQANLGL